MARVGLLQAAAIALGIGLLMLGLVLPVRAASVSRAAGHVALSAATLILALECLMILSWIVTLWPLSNTTAINLGNETGSQTWPIDWHIQILFGFALLVAELTLATWALVTIMRPPLGEHAKHL